MNTVGDLCSYFIRYIYWFFEDQTRERERERERERKRKRKRKRERERERDRGWRRVSPLRSDSRRLCTQEKIFFSLASRVLPSEDK